jgi:hypothetical protein
VSMFVVELKTERGWVIVTQFARFRDARAYVRDAKASTGGQYRIQ